MTKITLTEYIVDIAQDHNIETTSNHFKRLRRAFTKQLQESGLWTSAESNDVGAKVFNVEDLDSIYCVIEDKVLDIINDYIHECDTNEFWKMYNDAKRKEEEFKEMENLHRKYEVRYATDEMKNNLMLKAIYSVFFHDIDSDQWNQDLQIMNEYDREERRASFYKQEFREMTEEEIEAYNRMNNPVRGYCLRKRI